MNNHEFKEEVYKLVPHIPKGKVATYGQIAAMLGHPLASRAVGNAMRNVPKSLNLPCHRVVNRLGEMAPNHVFGSKENQKKILESEGVIFKENGLINMQKCLWRDW